MSMRRLLPVDPLRYLRLVRLRFRHPTCKIFSGNISMDIKLGNHCEILPDVQIFERVSIGEYSYVNSGAIVGPSSIGKFVSIGYRSVIGLHEHPVDYITTSPRIYGNGNILSLESQWNDFSSQVIVGNDVWIGANAVILQGVKIEDGAIVAAGAVVTKDVPSYAIVAGVPAKVIKMRFEPPVIEYLKNMRWWDLGKEQVKKLRQMVLKKSEWTSLIDE